MPIPEQATMKLTFFIPDGNDKIKKTRTISTTLNMTDCMYDSIMKLANSTEKQWPLNNCANPKLLDVKSKSFESTNSKKDTVENVLANHGFITNGELKKNIEFLVYFENFD